MKKRKLSDEDHLLWTTVARTVRPLRPYEARMLLENHVLPPETTTPASKVADSASEFENAVDSDVKKRTISFPSQLDRPTHQKISKGRLLLEARVDLHGMTQSQAYEALLYFLQQAYMQQRRHVLVITGKGSAGAGVLRRSVPEWIKTPLFRPYVSGLDNAARHHGGDGALYIRLRKQAR